MALKKITENPRITDTILFELETPDAEGCFISDPYRVDQVIIYYIERDFLRSNYGEYERVFENQDYLQAVQQAQAVVCADPSEENLQALSEAVNKLESAQIKTTYYYSDRSAIEVFGNPLNPAWLSTDTTNALLTKVEEDEDGNPVVGQFTLEWDAAGAIREGDYFICWTWSPLAAGEKLSAHLPFSISGDPKAVTTIPAHVTADQKYEILLERYLPEMYKTRISDADLTPETTLKFNKAVGDGFTVLEDFANQIIDLFDANALHESLLTYLSNLFNLKLKSDDPTLWRRQIKEAVPLFKKKGTYPSLVEAFAQAGMALNKYTQYWQIVSPYTWQECFRVENSATWMLEKDNIELPIDESNFGLWLRRSTDSTATQLTSEYVTFKIDEDACKVYMTWIGDELSSNPKELFEGDCVRVLYQYKPIPDLTSQQLEDYIQTLPLADLRDEFDQNYPPKNWNVRLIDEEDPLFDILIPTKHPFHEPIVFGYIRTEFPYGENIYNMEEYNGSTRPSFDACNIDKSFRDPCGACLSSKYSVDVGVEELSNDRMVETQEILNEYMPFHAQTHTINFSGDIVEFVVSPVEDIDFLINVNITDNHLSGQANPFFHRTMSGGLTGPWIIDHQDLADKTTVLSGKLGTAFNTSVTFISPDVNLENLGVKPLGKHILEVLSPSANAGQYTISEIQNRTAVVSGTIMEPVDESQFTFRLSNIVHQNNYAVSITQANRFTFSDVNVDFGLLGVKGNWDVANIPDYTGGAWEVLIPSLSATPFVIDDIINGELILVDDGSLPASGTFSYTLKNDLGANVTDSTSGVLASENRGYVNLNDPHLINREEIVLIGDFLFYDNIEYEIIEFDGDDKFYIFGWTNGNVVGVNIQVRRRLVESSVGQFGYRGLQLITFADHESEFGIMNGSNPPSPILDNDSFKENYMFLINSQFFRILEWDGVNVKLAGREQSWTTLNNGGTTVAYSLVHFPKKQANVQFIVFDHLDRDGHDPVIRTIEDMTDMNQAIVALSSGPSSGVQEQVGQDESVSFIIETKDGNKQEGEI